MTREPLRKQKLGLATGAVLGACLTLVAVLLLVAFGSRDSKRRTPDRPAAQTMAVYTLRSGDVVRDPRTGTRCQATGEAGIPNLLCTHTTRGRYSAVFWDDELQVYGPVSEPFEPTYSFKFWRLTR